MPAHPTFVIAEIGVNHNGSEGLALQLLEEAAASGADAAKFQTFSADTIAAPGAGTVAYQKTHGGDDQKEMLRRLELSDAAHDRLAARCAQLGIEFMSTAFDLRSLEMLCGLGIRRIKIPSGEITNLPYVEACARKNLPIILSTGMSGMAEVEEAFALIRATWSKSGGPDLRHDSAALTVLHCTSAYPTAAEDVNLRAMTRMRTELNCAVGYSDHTAGILAAPLAVVLGASVIEKHVTLDRAMEGPDHSASIEPEQLRQMIADIRLAEVMLGSGEKKATPAEEEARTLVRRGLKAARRLDPGTVLTEGDIAILRPATGIEPKYLSQALGRALVVGLQEGDAIEFKHLG